MLARGSMLSGIFPSKSIFVSFSYFASSTDRCLCQPQPTVGGDHPFLVDSYDQIAMAHHSKGDHDRALACYEKALAIMAFLKALCPLLGGGVQQNGSQRSPPNPPQPPSTIHPLFFFEEGGGGAVRSTAFSSQPSLFFLPPPSPRGH